jgi:hypothetical protein
VLLPMRTVVDLVLVVAGGPGYLLRVPAAMTVGWGHSHGLGASVARLVE